MSRSFSITALLLSGCLTLPSGTEGKGDIGADAGSDAAEGVDADLPEDMSTTDGSTSTDTGRDGAVPTDATRDATRDADPNTDGGLADMGPDCADVVDDELIRWDFRQQILGNEAASAMRLAGYDLYASSTPIYGTDGLLIDSDATAYRYPQTANSPALTELKNRAVNANGITIEAWVDPLPLVSQPDIAPQTERRIVTWSDGVCRRNVSLIWDFDAEKLGYRFNYGGGGEAVNGIPQYRATYSGDALTHVVLTLATDGDSRLYANGTMLNATAEDSLAIAANFMSEWDERFAIAVGDEPPSAFSSCAEPGNRDLFGEYRLVAFHAGAIPANRVAELYACRNLGH